MATRKTKQQQANNLKVGHNPKISHPQQRATSPVTPKTVEKSALLFETNTIPAVVVAMQQENKRDHENKLSQTEFIWLHGGEKVFVTGDFDNWQGSIPMKRAGDTNNFVATIPLDRSKNHMYKFVVDGEWKHSDDLPTEQDHNGHVNNVVLARPTSDNHGSQRKQPSFAA